MKTNIAFVAAAVIILPMHAPASQRGSTDYSVISDVADAGGRRASSASYTNDGSAGSVVGICTVSSPAVKVKHGYIGQLYESAGFGIAASPTVIAEGGTRQLEAVRALDDGSLLAIDAALVAWSVLTGPIDSISAGGLAAAGIVYQEEFATVHGIFEGIPADALLTVTNDNSDNYLDYAGDSVDDDWQVSHFGLPPGIAAGPLDDPDGDGQNNRFEFIAGLNPQDPASVFRLRIEKSPAPSNAKRLMFRPRLGDRSYQVWFRPNLTNPPLWDILGGTTQIDSGDERTVTDPNPVNTTRFYRVEITKP